MLKSNRTLLAVSAIGLDAVRSLDLLHKEPKPPALLVIKEKPMNPNLLLANLGLGLSLPHMNHVTHVPTPLHDELNPPKGRTKLFAALKRDGLMEKFKSGELDVATINKYVAECIPLHEQERMAKAALKQQRKAKARHDLAMGYDLTVEN